MSKTYQEQLALCRCETEAYNNIWKSNVWTITDYEELFEDISLGYVIQDPDNNYFILNPDWDSEDDEEEKTFVKWTPDFFGGDTCYFCKTKNTGYWTDCEDAVCKGCSDKWEYNEGDEFHPEEGYYKKEEEEHDEDTLMFLLGEY